MDKNKYKQLQILRQVSLNAAKPSASATERFRVVHETGYQTLMAMCKAQLRESARSEGQWDASHRFNFLSNIANALGPQRKNLQDLDMKLAFYETPVTRDPREDSHNAFASSSPPSSASEQPQNTSPQNDEDDVSDDEIYTGDVDDDTCNEMPETFSDALDSQQLAKKEESFADCLIKSTEEQKYAQDKIWYELEREEQLLIWNKLTRDDQFYINLCSATGLVPIWGPTGLKLFEPRELTSALRERYLILQQR